MSIWLYTGTPGSGKSFHAAKDIVSRLKRPGGIITATVIEMNPAEELMIEPAVTGLSLLPIYFLQSQHFRQIDPVMYF